MATRKNKAAVALGKLGGKARMERLRAEGKQPFGEGVASLGGKAGGAARAAKLTPEERSEIAKKAAAARWAKKRAASEENL